MKFLTLSMYSEGHGGYERHRRISRALIKAGHDVVWMAPGIKSGSGEEFIPLIEAYSWLSGPLGWVLRVRANLAYHRECLKDVDAVFTSKEYDAFGCILDPFVCKLPHIFFLHGDTIECEKYILENSQNFRRRLKSALLLCFYPWLQRLILKRFSHVVVQAKFLAEKLRARHSKVNCEYIVLRSDCEFDWHPETVDQGQIVMIKDLKEQGKFLIAMIAQAFYKAKGFDVFLDAMSRLRDIADVHAVIIGYGDEAHLIPKNIERLGLESQVTFLGRAPSAHSLMSFMDVIVSPTQFFDSFPTVVLEAMEANCCIIASDIDAHRAQLLESELMFPNGDANSLATHINRLYTNESTRHHNRELVKARKKYFEFDWGSQVVKILEKRVDP